MIKLYSKSIYKIQVEDGPINKIRSESNGWVTGRQLDQLVFKREQNQKMSLKEMTRAGESGGRKAAVREELLPSQHPLPKPTRDVSASNRSHSLTHQEPPLFPSQRRLLIIDRQAQEVQFQKQANVLYARQFRTLAKLLGNEYMDFEEVREKVEGLVLGDRQSHDPLLMQRIQTLEWELARKGAEVRSSQNLPTSQEYLRGLETELGRKSKMITQLSDSVKRQAFESAVRELQSEIEAKTAELKAVEEQAQESRMRTNASLSLLEEELIRHKQTIQKLTFELDSQKRRAQNSAEDVERLKRREKELSASLQNEGKATYQGLSYSGHAILLQLQARDQQLSASLTQQHAIQQEINSLRRQHLQSQQLIRHTQQDLQALQIKLEYQQSQKVRLLEEIEQVTRELQLRNQAVSLANANQQSLHAEKQRTESALLEVTQQMKQMEAGQIQSRLEREEYVRKIAQHEEVISNLTIHLQQARVEVDHSNQQLNHLQSHSQTLQSQLAQLNRVIESHQHQFQLKDQQIQNLRAEIIHQEEQYKHHIENTSTQYQQQIQSLHFNLTNQQTINRQTVQRYTSLSTKTSFFQAQIIDLNDTIAHQAKVIKQKQENLIILDQRIQAFQQEKYLLMHRLEDSERDWTELIAEKQRHLEEAIRSRSALQMEINTRKNQQQHLRILLDEATTKEAQIQADIEQKDLQLNDMIDERKRQSGQYQLEVARLTRFVQELQQQLQHQKHGQEGRLQEEYRAREELLQEVQTLRVTLTQLEMRQKEEKRTYAEFESRTQQIQHDIRQKYDEERQNNQHLLQENDQLKYSHKELTTIIQQYKYQITSNETKQVELQRHFHSQLQQLQLQINDLKAIIQQLKTEKSELQHQLQTQRKSKDNELGSFSFNHFEGQHQESTVNLKIVIQKLQRQLDAYRRDDEQRIRLSYSNTVQGSASPALIGSLQSERQYLQSQNRRLQQELISHKNQFIQKQNQLIHISNDLQMLRTKLEEYEHLLQQKDTIIVDLNNEIRQQRDTHNANTQQYQLHYEEIIIQKESEFTTLRQRYNQCKETINRQQQELISITQQLQRIKQAREVQSVTQQLEKTKFQLTKATEQITKLKIEISSTFRLLQTAKLEADNERRITSQLKKKAEDYEHRVSELEERARKDFEEPHRILSRLSKRSNVSEHQLQQIHSKASSDGQLSRRILNDPSKISGQESKFAHNLLVFENSKIHVTREVPVEIALQKEIKQQRQEESVLSKQQLQKTPESSHRQINTTHFDRPSNDNSKKDVRQSPHNISQSRGSRHDTSRQSNHSLTSIRQAEEVQEASLPPAQPSSVSSNQKEAEAKPKEYLPQQSSKRTISNPNEPKQNIIPQQQQQPSQKPSFFYRNSQQSNVPIYVARPSPLQPHTHEKRESSQSQSGSKTKVRISYGQPSDKSIQIKRRQPPKQMAASQVSRVSMQSNKLPPEASINQVSPIQMRNSNIQNNQTPPSLFSSQRREHLHSRQSTHNDIQEPPSQSIINGINQIASRLSNYGNPRQSIAIQPPKFDGIIRRESSPIYVQPRIETAHSPRHSNVIAFNPIRTYNSPSSTIKPEQPRIQPTQRQQQKREELTVPPSKIVMRSVIGGKRNSLLNDTATFGKNSQKGPLNETFSESNDSGIDVMQIDWMNPCCKNN